MFGTIISGVVIASIVRLIQKNIFEPVQEYKKKLWEINNLLKYYAADFYNDWLDWDDRLWAKDRIRQVSCDLDELYRYIPYKCMLKRLWFSSIKSEEDINGVASSLIFLSNIVWRSVQIAKDVHGNIHSDVMFHKLNIKSILWFYMTQKDIDRYKKSKK
jgi:hypothetical protein